MKTITVKPSQNVFDIVLEQYGTLEAVGEFLAGNPDLQNDPKALVALGIDPDTAMQFQLDAAVLPGSRVAIDEKSILIDKNLLRDLTDEITTYDYGTEN